MPSRLDSESGVRSQIESLRRNLLDLTMRNRMLNYRPSVRFSVEMKNEDVSQVFKRFVEEEKKFSFVGIPDAPRRLPKATDLFDRTDKVAAEEFRRAAEDEIDAFLDIPGLPTERTDTKFQVDESETLLQAKLKTIEREAKSANDELGINTLFLTLGMLEWDDGVGGSNKSPLLFVPVKFERHSNGSLRLSHDGTDLGANLPLKAKMEEFNVALPEWKEDSLLFEYFSELESTIHSRHSWHLDRDAIHLAFFNYEKFSMYIDLGGDSWPEGSKPWQNPDVIALLGTGYSSPESPVNESTDLDEVRPVQATREVFDADSSQTLAMIRAAEGFSIVVEGPPGTGKSQTITNIVAEAVAAGKTVLFVSAKRAALEVVKRNLERADLGPMCLDLHDKLTNRRAFYEEIKQTVSKTMVAKSEDQKVGRLTELRSRLNEFCLAVNDTIGPFDISPFEIMAELGRLPPETAEDRDGRVDFSALRKATYVQIQSVLPAVRDLEAKIQQFGAPSQSPFWGCDIDQIDPAMRLDLQEELRLGRTEYELASNDLNQAAATLRISTPTSFREVQILRVCLEQALAAPIHDGATVNVEVWKLNLSSIRSFIEFLRIRNRIRAELRDQVKDEIWKVDLRQEAAAFSLHSPHWYRFLSGEFRSANQRIDLLLTSQAPSEPSERLKIIEQVLEVQGHEGQIGAMDNLAAQMFGAQWRGLESDPDVLDQLQSWLLSLHDQIETGALPAGLLDLFSGKYDNDVLKELTLRAEKAVGAFLSRYLGITKLLRFRNENSIDRPLSDIGFQIDNWTSHLADLPGYVLLSSARANVRDQGFESILKVADFWPLGGQRLQDSVLRSYLTGVIREALTARPQLRSFDRSAHESAISDFRVLDDFKLNYNRAQVRIAHQLRLPTFDDATFGGLRALKTQCELQRRHRPIRWIMGQAGEAIQRIKPVFMMSPLSVAIHLPPDLPKFDMVIFDEASQIKPEDSLCAISRAKQCIVVGDTRQMPPTTFFSTLSSNEDENELLESKADTETGKLESILSLMSAVTMGRVRQPDLRWHYRSLHSSLIQPSNEMFYGNRLIVFPNPSSDLNGERVGVVFSHVPASVYEPGVGKRINRIEAEAIADRVMDHVKSCASESLLIAAMNKPQADLIYELLQLRERADPEPFQEFRKRHPFEPLEVKNLENVQGDERDVVFISITYGRDAEGKLRQTFGPLLLDGGERRLNVLITRARKRCEIFSNLVAEDIRSDGSGPGVEALKTYLRFAETGYVGNPVSSSSGESSLFEMEICRVLKDNGFDGIPNVGSEGYRIDVGVVDPNRPDTYLLGIECDGPTYGSARSARDRDKLRQRVLESRGWRLHRIWSTDWWQNRDGETQRLLEALEKTTPEQKEPLVPIPSLLVESGSASAKPPQLRPYVVLSWDKPISKLSELEEFAAAVVREEGPIERELLKIRLKEKLFTAKLNVDAAIGSVAGRVLTSGTTLFWSNSQASQARDWSRRPTDERKVTMVPAIEIAAALRAVSATAYGIQDPDAAKGAWTLMGFKPISEARMKKGTSILQGLVESGVLIRRENGLLYLV